MLWLYSITSPQLNLKQHIKKIGGGGDAKEC